jgi:hypothetical protein
MITELQLCYYKEDLNRWVETLLKLAWNNTEYLTAFLEHYVYEKITYAAL